MIDLTALQLADSYIKKTILNAAVRIIVSMPRYSTNRISPKAI